MTDADRKRTYVSDLYSGPNWKTRVKRMPDSQITAIYLKHQSDGQPPEHDEEQLVHDEDPHLDIPPNGRGPHANEDLFPLY